LALRTIRVLLLSPALLMYIQLLNALSPRTLQACIPLGHNEAERLSKRLVYEHV